MTLAVLLALMHSSDASADNAVTVIQEIHSSGYRYVHRGVAEHGDDGVVGVIEVLSPQDDVLTRITGFPPEKCNDFPGTGLLNVRLARNMTRQFVVMCGSDSGRRNTIIILLNETFHSILYFGDSNPALVSQDDGYIFTAPVYRRLIQRDGSLADMLVVYEWSPINNMNDFTPIFNTESADQYISYYNKIAKFQTSYSTEKIYEPLLAALISSSSATKICDDITNKLIPRFGASEVDGVMSFIEKYGFPHFDRKICSTRR